MTRSIETAAQIMASPEQVWAVLTDYRAYPEWNPYIVRIEGEAQVGSTLIVHAKAAPDRDILVSPVAVLAVEPPRVMRWEGGLPDRNLWRGDHWWIVESHQAGALLRHFEHFSGTLADTILAEHGETIRANFCLFNTALKARAEALS